jgi:hypothetical protein
VFVPPRVSVEEVVILVLIVGMGRTREWQRRTSDLTTIARSDLA